MSIFTGLLADVKEAGVERPDQQQMELDFSQMAFQFVIDRAPTLTPFGLGFEIVERDDDGTKVCGIFGYKIGQEFYMIPVFFINGQIKGINSIYSKSTNMFQPLTEKVIDKIISRSTIELGNGVTRSSVQRNLLMPSLANFKSMVSGTGTKYASVLKEMWDKAAVDSMTMLENDPLFQREVAGALLKQADDLDPFPADGDLISYLKSTGPKSVHAFLGAVMTDAKFASAVVDLYGSVDPFKIEEFNKGALEFQSKTASKNKVEIVFKENSGGCCSCPMSDKDRRRIVRDGFRIIDRRTPAETTELYNIEYPNSYNPPDKAGLYNLLLDSGVTTETWILRPFNIDKRNLLACVETDKHCIAMAPSKKVFARDGMIVDSKTAFDVAIDINDMKLGGRYLLVNKEGSYLGPFVIQTIANDPNERLHVNISWDWYSREHESGLYSYRDYDSDASRRTVLELVPGKGGQPRLSGTNTIVVPENDIKALALNLPTDGDGCAYNCAEAESFKPGNPLDIYSLLYKEGFSKIAVVQDPTLTGTCCIKVDGQPTFPMSYKKAFVTLIGNYGYSVDDADNAITEMDVKGSSSCLAHVKLAQDSSGVSIPWLQLPEFTGSDDYSGMMTQTPQSAEATGVQEQSLPPQEPFMPGMADGTARQPTPGAPDPQALQVAMQAAQSGQKTVFDHAGIAGLAKLYDVNTVIDSYIPEMMKALDRVGRILFLFQWKGDDFIERFGADSLPDMEDMLVSVYKSFGDLVLTLREKAINPDESATVNM